MLPTQDNQLRPLRGVIGCEESQAVTSAFNDRGHHFMSCDILPCSGGQPFSHYQGDLMHYLTDRFIVIDFLGVHPPCTYSANSGVRWLYNKDGSKNKERWEKMELGALFTKSCLAFVKSVGKGYVEQPILHKHALDIIGERPTQIIQPWQHGHGEQKSTCLWVIGLPPLKPSKIVEGREQKIWKMPPSKDRAKLRSKTFPGIAKAMAEQWSEDLTLKT